MSRGVTYLCDRGTGTKEERRGRGRSKVRTPVWELQGSVEQLALQQVTDLMIIKTHSEVLYLSRCSSMVCCPTY